MTRGLAILVGVIILVGAGLGIGVAALRPETGNSAGQVSQESQAAASLPGQGSRFGGGATGDSLMVTGVVEDVSQDSLSVRTQQGTAKVNLKANTSVRKTVTASLAEVAPGETAMVTGQRNADGTVAAASVQLGTTSAGEQGGPGMGMGRFSPQGTPTAGGQFRGNLGDMSFIAGTVESAGQGSLVIKTSGGSVTVTVPEQAVLRKTVAGDKADLKPGVTVLAVGQRGSDGVLTASSIQIVPEGEGGFRGRLSP